MMPVHRLSFRTLTVSALAVSLLAGVLFAFPTVWTSATSLVANVIQGIAPTESPNGDDPIAPTGTVYVWNQAGTASFNTAANWTPSRTVPAPDDILTFNNGATTTVTNIASQTVGQLLISGNTNVDLQAFGGAALTIAGDLGVDLSVESGSSVSVSSSGTNILTVLVGSGATGSISGSFTCAGAAHRLNALDANAVVFSSGGVFTQDLGCTGSAFGSTGTQNAVVFQSGSSFVQFAGANPFGFATPPSSKVVFQAGSLYSHRHSAQPSLSGRTYANFELNAPTANLTPIGAGALNVEDLTITAGTMNLNLTGNVSVNGNLSVASGANLNFSPVNPTGSLSLKGNIAVAGSLGFTPSNVPNYLLNGSSQQMISGAGTITFNGGQIIDISNPAGVVLQRNLDIAGAPLSVSGNGRLDFGTSFISGNLSTITTSATSTLGIGSPDGIATGTTTGNIRVSGARNFNAGTTFIYNGATNQVTGNALPAAVTNLTIANTGSVGNNTVTGSSTQGVSGLLRVQSGIASVATGASTSIGNVQIDSGAALSASGAIRIAGDWSNGGTFQANSGQVTLLPVASRTISGSTTFYDLVSSNALSTQITFGSGGTTTVTNNLTLAASGGGNVLTLRSSTAGAQWNLNLVSGATQSVSQVDVRDSNASGGQQISSPGSTNSGNNVNWSFGEMPEIDVTQSSISFGPQAVGSTSGTRSVTISNSGTGSLNIGQLVIDGDNPGDFTLVSGGDPSNTVIPAGGTAKVRVAFSPGATGPRTAQITIPSNDADEPTVVVGLSGAGVAGATPSPVKSMWVWNGTPNPVTDANGRADLIQRAAASGITDLYVSVYSSTPNSQDRLMFSSSDIEPLIVAAHTAGMEVWAAYGDPAWQDQPCTDGQSSYERMQEVAAYNAERGAEQRFDGVMLDVEPGGAFNLPNYANMHNCFRGILPSDIRLGTAISAFWHAPARAQVEYPTGGELKYPAEHIIDLPLDQIVVMGYRDNAGATGGNGIIGLDEFEIGYASSIGKSGLVLAGLETKNLAPDPDTHVTFFEEGNSVLESQSSLVASHFSSSIGFGGFSIHAYQDEYLSGVSGWPLPPFGTVNFANNSFSNTESGSISMELVRSGGTAGAVSVDVVVTNGAFSPATGGATCMAGVDYVNTTSTVSWAHGEGGSKFATIVVCDDAVLEPNESLNANLSNTTGGLTIGSGNQASGQIIDDDAMPDISVSPTSHNYGDVQQGTPSDQIFTISNTGSDTLSIGDLTFTGTNAGDFSIEGDDPSDAAIDPGDNVQVTVRLTPGGIGSRTAQLNIPSDDPDESPVAISLSGNGIAAPPTIRFVSATDTEDESQGVVVAVIRSGDQSGTSTVQYSTSGGSATGGASCGGSVDYVETSGTLTFNPGDPVIKQLQAIQICADAFSDAGESFAITLSSPTGAVIGSPSETTVEIRDTASQYRFAGSVGLDGSTGDPYPATINVASGPIRVGSVRVTLYDIVHPGAPGDLDVLLVGPGGQTFLLMADAGGSVGSSEARTLTFTDFAGQVLPQDSLFASGIYEPTSYGVGPEPNFPGAAPTGPYNEPGSAVGGTPSFLSTFGGASSIGQWSLYVRSDGGGDFSLFGDPLVGITGGWGLELLAPTAARATISGRVTTANGVGIRGALVSVQGMDGVSRTVVSNAFGYYRADGLTVGESFVVSVSSRRYVFATPNQFVNLSDSISDLNFVAAKNR